MKQTLTDYSSETIHMPDLDNNSMDGKLRIIFMGTPEFAVASLEAMIDAGYTPLAVVTAADKPAGRGLKTMPSPVKVSALTHSLPVLQPNDLTEPEFLSRLNALQPDLFVVVAFRKLPAALLSIPLKGAFNLHASLLPQYRGAAPIQRAIMNGETVTGVTTFLLNGTIDTGSILFCEKVEIHDDQNASSLHDTLMHTGAGLTVRTIQALETGTFVPVDQNSLFDENTILRKAPKIFREDCRIDWKESARSIYNQIRGLSLRPGAFTVITSPEGHEYELKILGATMEAFSTTMQSGSIETDGKSYLRISAHDAFLCLKLLQLSGKKIMNTDEFLRGFSINNAWQA
jgi:methionyl-tRNA formyltransferase